MKHITQRCKGWIFRLNLIITVRKKCIKYVQNINFVYEIMEANNNYLAIIALSIFLSFFLDYFILILLLFALAYRFLEKDK